MHLTHILLTSPETKALLLLSDPTCRCFHGNQCATPPPPIYQTSCCHASKPTYLQMALCNDTVNTHTHTCLPVHKNNIHTYTTDMQMMACPLRGVKTNIWHHQHQHAQNQMSNIYHSIFLFQTLSV